MLVRATYPFFVEKGGHIYQVGETYDATDRKAAGLIRMGVAVAVTEGDGSDGGEEGDLSGLTVAELRALCEERGIDAPKKATKQQLVDLLSE